MPKKNHYLAPFLLVALAPWASSQTGTGEWLSKALMPMRKSEPAGALLGGRIYVAGGGPTEGGQREMHVYTPASDKWESAPPLPEGLHHLHLGAAAGKLYVLGGCDHARVNTTPKDAPWIGSRHTFEFDPAAGTAGQWRRLENRIPHSTGMGGVAAFGGKLYVIGGVDTNGVTLNLVQEFDPATGAWRQRKPMPTAREHAGIAVLDSLIYVVAGRLKGLGGVSVTDFEAYSPASDTWYTLPKLPTARSGLALAASKGKLYALGGEWPGTQTTHEEYDPVKRSWRAVKPRPIARHGFAAVTMNDTIYVTGFVQATDAFIPPGPTTAIVPRPGETPRWVLGAGLNLYSVDGRRLSGAGAKSGTLAFPRAGAGALPSGR